VNFVHVHVPRGSVGVCACVMYVPVEVCWMMREHVCTCSACARFSVPMRQLMCEHLFICVTSHARVFLKVRP